MSGQERGERNDPIWLSVALSLASIRSSGEVDDVCVTMTAGFEGKMFVLLLDRLSI